jgi:hypothetical protein
MFLLRSKGTLSPWKNANADGERLVARRSAHLFYKAVEPAPAAFQYFPGAHLRGRLAVL